MCVCVCVYNNILIDMLLNSLAQRVCVCVFNNILIDMLVCVCVCVCVTTFWLICYFLLELKWTYTKLQKDKVEPELNEHIPNF